MSEKPPLTDNEVYDLIHQLWLRLAAEKGATDYGNNTLRAAKLALFVLNASMVKREEDQATEAQMPSLPSEHSD